MKTVLKWLAGLVAAAGAVTLLVSGFQIGRRELMKESRTDAAIKSPARIAKSSSGDLVVTLPLEVQSRAGLKTVALSAATWQPTIVAYGELRLDPLRSFTLRAAVRGIVQETGADRWPEVGTSVPDNTRIGEIQPLLGPLEHLDVAARLVAAQSDTQEHRALLTAAEESLERKRTLNAEDGVVPVRELEQAQALVLTEQARLEAALAKTELMRTLLSPAATDDLHVPAFALRVPRGAQVVRVLARPGETVAEGQEMLEFARFDRLIARVELPAGEQLDSPALAARIVVLGHEDHPLDGVWIGAAPMINPRTRGPAFLFSVQAGGLNLRPGAAVRAELRPPGAALSGVAIPRTAVVYAAGGAWTFVRVSDEEFVRRGVVLSASVPTGWFVESGFSPGQLVVTDGAQMLLSELLKARIRIGEGEQ